MAAASNDALTHQDHCAICMEALAVRTTVTLRCRHSFHFDCLGSAFNAVDEMRCPVCRAVEEGAWRTFPTRAPQTRRAGALALQEYVQGPPVQMQPPSGIYWSLDQGWFSGSLSLGNGGPIRRHHAFQYRRRETTHVMMGSVNGSGWASASSHATMITHLRLGVDRRANHRYPFRGNVGPNVQYDPFPQGVNSIQPAGLEAPDVAFLGEPILNNRASGRSFFECLAAAALVGQSMSLLPSPPVHAMMHAANSHFSSSGLLPSEQTAFQAEGSGAANIQLPNVGEVVLGDGADGSGDMLSDGEASVEDLSE